MVRIVAALTGNAYEPMEKPPCTSHRFKFLWFVPTGGSGLSLLKNDFELGIGGEGRDTSQHFEGSFGSICAILPCEASEQKLGQKPKPELKEIKLSYCNYSICLNEHLLFKERQNWIKNDEVMAI